MLGTVEACESGGHRSSLPLLSSFRMRRRAWSSWSWSEGKAGLACTAGPWMTKSVRASSSLGQPDLEPRRALDCLHKACEPITALAFAYSSTGVHRDQRRIPPPGAPQGRCHTSVQMILSCIPEQHPCLSLYARSSWKIVLKKYSAPKLLIILREIFAIASENGTGHRHRMNII